MRGEGAMLFQEAVNNLRFGLLASETERHELIELLAGDFTDGGFVNKLGIDVFSV